MFLLRLLRTPTAFERAPWKYALNQLGHAYIVGFLSAWLLGWAAIPAIAMAYGFWEFLQWRRYGAMLSDCLEDLGHVMTGSVAAFFPWLILPHLILLAAGVQWRRENVGQPD